MKSKEEILSAFEILTKKHDYIQKNGEKPSEYNEDKIIEAMEEYAKQFQSMPVEAVMTIKDWSYIMEGLVKHITEGTLRKWEARHFEDFLTTYMKDKNYDWTKIKPNP